MKKNLFFVLCLSIAAAAWATVDISEIGVGARPLGMGKASVGGLDDATAIFTNPAALTLNRNLNVVSMSGNLFADVNYLMVGGAENLPFGRFGVGYVNASVTGIPITTITGTGSTAAVSWESSADYGSSIVFLSYATPLSRFLMGNFPNISVGASLKTFLQGFTGGVTPTSNPLRDANGTGMDMDLGATWQVDQWVRLGATLNNCLPMSAGGKFTWQKNGVEESIPMATRLGGTFLLLGEKGWRQANGQTLSFNLELESGRGANRPAVWHSGFEYWPTEILALRYGLDQKPRATETGTGIDNNLTAGIGLKYLGFTFDYAYHQFGDLAENATHFFSFGYRGLDKEPVKQALEAVRKEAAPLRPEVAPKPAVKQFADVAEGFWARRPIEYLATLNVMSGYPDGTFRPDRTLTRGELAALLVKAKGFPLDNNNKKQIFRDVKPNSWLGPYVRIAVERQYVKGYPDGTFKPDQQISRAEAAMVLAKFAGLYVKPKVDANVFADIKPDHWAAGAIAAGKSEGLYEYLAGKPFEPRANLSRAEAAEILSKTPLIKQKIRELISGEQ